MELGKAYFEPEVDVTLSLPMFLMSNLHPNFDSMDD
jgi:hypothetical protein